MSSLSQNSPARFATLLISGALAVFLLVQVADYCADAHIRSVNLLVAITGLGAGWLGTWAWDQLRHANDSGGRAGIAGAVLLGFVLGKLDALFGIASAANFSFHTMEGFRLLVFLATVTLSAASVLALRGQS